jgi:hypothetical protein
MVTKPATDCRQKTAEVAAKFAAFLLALSQPGLPDGLFSNKNPNLGIFCRVLQWKTLVYFTDVWSILRPFGIFVHIWYILWSLGIFFPFWYFAPRKIWQPWSQPGKRRIHF